jgi:hypothetical protein
MGGRPPAPSHAAQPAGEIEGGSSRRPRPGSGQLGRGLMCCYRHRDCLVVVLGSEWMQSLLAVGKTPAGSWRERAKER